MFSRTSLYNHFKMVYSLMYTYNCKTNTLLKKWQLTMHCYLRTPVPQSFSALNHEASKAHACLLACSPRHCRVSEITSSINSLHCCLSRVNREHSATVLFDHSLMSSVHLHLGLPRLFFPSSLPSSISVHRFLALITWPTYWSLCRCTVVSRRSCGCTSY